MPQTRPHWTIHKIEHPDEHYPWHFQHAHDDTDPHYQRDHECGSSATFREAVIEVNALSWTECGLPRNRVPFYGLELGINTPDGERTSALDVAGFRYMEEATAYAETLRGCAAREAMDRAERQGHMASPMDADDDALHLPLVGATVYFYDPKVGTTSSFDLLSWERPALTPTS